MIAIMPERSTVGAMMAKKKPVAAEVPFNPRAAGKQTLEIAAIRELITNCAKEFADMEIILTHANALQLDAIEVEGATKLRRAHELLGQFAYSLEIGVTKTHRKNRRS